MPNPNSMPWDIQELMIVLEAAGGTPGNLDWSASVDTLLSVHAVQLIGAYAVIAAQGEARYEVFQLDPQASEPENIFGPLTPGMHAPGGFGWILTKFPIRVAGRSLAEGDTATITLYYRT
jgi:hypothetical protein